MMELIVSFTGLVEGPPEALEAHFCHVMDHLLDQESEALYDFDLSADLEAGTVEITVVSVGATVEECTTRAIPAIRSAIHAAGGRTDDSAVLGGRRLPGIDVEPAGSFGVAFVGSRQEPVPA
jgi:hypothetical protein